MQKRMTMQHKRRTMMTHQSVPGHGISAGAGGGGRRKSVLRTGEGLEVHFDPSTGRGYTHNEATGELKWLTVEESQNLHKDGGSDGDEQGAGGDDDSEESDDDEDSLR